MARTFKKRPFAVSPGYKFPMWAFRRAQSFIWNHVVTEPGTGCIKKSAVGMLRLKNSIVSQKVSQEKLYTKRSEKIYLFDFSLYRWNKESIVHTKSRDKSIERQTSLSMSMWTYYLFLIQIERKKVFSIKVLKLSTEDQLDLWMPGADCHSIRL